MVTYAPGAAAITVDRTPVEVGARVVLTCDSADPGHPGAQYRWKLPGKGTFDQASHQELVIQAVSASLNAHKVHGDDLRRVLRRR